MLIFEEKKYRYFIDGVEVPSVSEVTRFLSKDVYGEIDDLILEEAAKKGTKVHKATEELDKSKSVEVDYEISGYVEAYAKFIEENKVQWLLSECSIHKDYEYAGTLDRYGWINDELSIVDFKTSSKITGKHKQLYTAAQNLYRMALETAETEVRHLYILHLKKDGTYKLIELPIEDTLANACLTLHNAMKTKKRKVKSNG